MILQHPNIYLSRRVATVLISNGATVLNVK